MRTDENYISFSAEDCIEKGKIVKKIQGFITIFRVINIIAMIVVGFSMVIIIGKFKYNMSSGIVYILYAVCGMIVWYIIANFSLVMLEATAVNIQNNIVIARSLVHMSFDNKVFDNFDEESNTKSDKKIIEFKQ